jgi:hypothetical protein
MPTAFIRQLSRQVDATPAQHAHFASDVKKVINAFVEQTDWCPNRVKTVARRDIYRHGACAALSYVPGQEECLL